MWHHSENVGFALLAPLRKEDSGSRWIETSWDFEEVVNEVIWVIYHKSYCEFENMFHSKRPTNHKLKACIKFAPNVSNSCTSCTMKIQTQDLCLHVSVCVCGLNFNHPPYGRSLLTRDSSPFAWTRPSCEVERRGSTAAGAASPLR